MMAAAAEHGRWRNLAGSLRAGAFGGAPAARGVMGEGGFVWMAAAPGRGFHASEGSVCITSIWVVPGEGHSWA